MDLEFMIQNVLISTSKAFNLGQDISDAEIAALKAQLAAYTKTKTATDTKEMQKQYKEKFDKEVPLRYKNDETWIAKKLAE